MGVPGNVALPRTVLAARMNVRPSPDPAAATKVLCAGGRIVARASPDVVDRTTAAAGSGVPRAAF